MNIPLVAVCAVISARAVCDLLKYSKSVRVFRRKAPPYVRRNTDTGFRILSAAVWGIFFSAVLLSSPYLKTELIWLSVFLLILDIGFRYVKCGFSVMYNIYSLIAKRDRKRDCCRECGIHGWDLAMFSTPMFPSLWTSDLKNYELAAVILSLTLSITVAVFWEINLKYLTAEKNCKECSGKNLCLKKKLN